MLRVLGLTFAILGITAIVDAAPVRAAANDLALTGRVISAADRAIEAVFIDNSGSRPVFWAGSNHDAGILKMEPLD